jgi:SAM-dependent methyltransferase
MKIIQWLKLPELRRAENLDSSFLTILHKGIIERKRFIKRLYADWYAVFKKNADKFPGGICVELGSGGGFLKKALKEAVTSDILFVPGIDLNFSGFNMPFRDKSVRCFFMIDVLHHVKGPALLFDELRRCLEKNGKVIMIEPANTLWGRFVWRYLHPEGFDPLAGWGLNSDDPLRCANSAMPWIIFSRDRKKFENDFPELKVKRLKYHTPMLYLAGGGISMRQIFPSASYNIFKILEFILSPFNAYLGMFMTIEIEKV